MDTQIESKPGRPLIIAFALLGLAVVLYFVAHQDTKERPVLDGLDRVDWKNLEHAYGSAEDVPDLLRALAATQKEEREKAIYALYGNIWHQGTVYQATASAVPFLVELAAAPEVQDREEILELLYQIAHGSSYLDVHQHLDFVGKTLKEDPDFEKNKAEELRRVDASRIAVVDGLPTYLALLDDASPAVRRHAGKLLTTCSDEKERLSGTLLEHYGREADPATRATLLYAIGSLRLESAAELCGEALSHEAGIIRVAAALAISFFSLSPMDDRIVKLLIDTLDSSEAVEYDLFPFGEDLHADIAAALTRVDEAQKPEVAAILLDAVEAGRGAPFYLAEPLLALSFEAPLEKPSLDDLTELQQRTLRWVAGRTWTKTDGTWSIFANFSEMLRAYGLEELGHEVSGYEQ